MIFKNGQLQTVRSVLVWINAPDSLQLSGEIMKMETIIYPDNKYGKYKTTLIKLIYD